MTSKRNKSFNTAEGVFNYHKTPLANLYCQVKRHHNEEYQFLMAKPFKALCDYVYCYKKDYKSLSELQNDLRLDLSEPPLFFSSERQELIDYYNSKRIKKFIKLFEQDKLNQYNCKNLLEEENAIKEITQEIALLTLSRAGFFKIAEFHGGTALRILYNLPRFSEDLDFALLQPNNDIKLLPFLNKMADEFSTYGYDIEINDRSKADTTIKKVLSLRYPVLNGVRKNIKIKVELDSNPPAGATVVTKYLDFPQAFSIQCKDLASSFAGKCHALLCRNHVTGRDWYDFVWYIARNTKVNYKLLQNALMQQGPWQGKIINCNSDWLTTNLINKIESINWKKAANDVAPFLSANEQHGLEVWSKDFFISRADKFFVNHEKG